jgi:hypothetical protein
MDVNFYMLIADIYAVDKSTPCTLVTNPVSSTQGTSSASAGQPSVESVISLGSSHLTSRNLTGSTVASGNLLTSLEGEPGVYFVFQDLSVRSEGAYTLRFSFTLPPTYVSRSIFYSFARKCDPPLTFFLYTCIGPMALPLLCWPRSSLSHSLFTPPSAFLE